MAKVGAQRAAELTGKSKSTIQRSMNNGKLSFELDPNGRKIVDVSELERVFGLENANSSNATSSGAGAPSVSVEQELEKASALIEMERMKMRVKMLETQLESAEDQLEDLKSQRDQWQKQASQVLLTSQYSQKQAEDLAEQLKQREIRARERRDQIEAQRLKERMAKLEANNQNTNSSAGVRSEDMNDAQGEGAVDAVGQAFSGLWKRVKKA